MRSLLVFLILLVPFFACKPRAASNLKDGDLRKFGSSPKVIYATAKLDPKNANVPKSPEDGSKPFIFDKVYLISCPVVTENGVVVDHLDDKKFMGREKCNTENYDRTIPKAQAVQEMDYVTQYLPLLKQEVGFMPGEPATTGEVEELEAALRKFNEKLASINGAGSTDSDPQLIKEQVDAAKTEITRLENLLGFKGTSATDKIQLLNTLVGFLSATSKRGFNIGQNDAVKLMAPFRKWEIQSIAEKEQAVAAQKLACLPERRAAQRIRQIDGAIVDEYSGYFFKDLGQGCWPDANGMKDRSVCPSSAVAQGCPSIGAGWYLISKRELQMAKEKNILTQEDNSYFYWTRDDSVHSKGSSGKIICYALASTVDPEGNIDGDKYTNAEDVCNQLTTDCTSPMHDKVSYSGLYTGCQMNQTPDMWSDEKQKLLEAEKLRISKLPPK